MEEKEKFLSRWSRLKRATARELPAAAPQEVPAVAVPLPPLDALDFTSDFKGFLQPQVEESLKRAALKKLFRSGHFNQMDGLDVYIDDYNSFEPIPEEMLRRMKQARGLLFPEDGETQDPIPLARDAADAHSGLRENSRPLPSGTETREEEKE